MNSRAPNSRHVLAGEKFQPVCKGFVYASAFQCFSFCSYLSGCFFKNRLKKDRNDDVVRRKRGTKVHQTTGWELDWEGLEVRGISVRLWEPSVKNPNHFLSQLLALSRCPRSPSQHLLSFSNLTPPPCCFPPIFLSDFLLLSFTAWSLKRTRRVAHISL